MSKVKSLFASLAVAVALVPSVVGAQIIDLGRGDLRSAFDMIMVLINTYAIPFLIALAILYFLYGVLQFIMNADDDTKRAAGRNKIIYGLVGLVVMVSVWGLIGFVQRSFGLQNQPTNVGLPSVPTRTISR